MNLSVNGELKLIETKDIMVSLLFVIEQLGVNSKLIVVEFNGEIINSKNWSEQKVQDGDVLEIVTIVGGG